nr:hypothetical protein HK105_006479 [Polyrhizophydium stewartii]
MQRAHKENDAVKRATETKKRLQARAEASKAGKELARLKTKIRGQTVRRGPGRDPSPLRASSDGATPAAPASGDAAPPAPTPSAAERLMATIAASDLPTLPDTAVMTASERLRFESAPKSTFMSLLPPPAEGIRMLKPVEGEAAFLSRLTVRRKKPTINLLDTSIDDIADSLLKQAAKESSGIASQAISEESLGSPTESLQSSVLTLDADLDAEVDGVPLAGADDAAEPASDGADRTAGPAGVESPPELDVGTLDEPKGGLAVSSMLLRVGSLATARKTMRRVRKQFSPELTRRMAELSAEDEATEAEPALIDPAAAESAADQPPADEPGVADGPAEDAAAKGDVAE